MTDDRPFGTPRSPRRTALGIALFLGLAAVVLVAIRRLGGGDAAPDMAAHDHAAVSGADSARPVSLTPEEARRIGVTYAAVERGPLEHEVRVVGVVQADETRVRTVVARLEGYVERLLVDRTGQPVRAGQSLLEYYAPMAVAAQQDLLLARQLERDVAAGSPDAQAAARSGVEAARQRLRQWEVPPEAIAQLEQSGAPLRTVPLRTPYGGFVLEKSVLQGQRVMAGDPLYRIADLSAVWIEGEVFEQDLPLLRVGTAVTATFQALPGMERTGRIAYVYPTLDPETRTARVRVELANRDLALKPGMYATLIFTGRAATGLSVPRSAVLATGRRNLVFLKGAGTRFEPREITVGVSSGDRVQVLGGLAPGDTVVASATFLIDAESNLGSLLGGMGDMPGMDMGPPTTGPRPGPGAAPPRDTAPAADDMSGMDHSQMDHSTMGQGAPPAADSAGRR